VIREGADGVFPGGSSKRDRARRAGLAGAMVGFSVSGA
jgi:hypothetical protein